MDFSPTFVLVDGKLSSLGVWIAIFATAAFLWLLALGIVQGLVKFFPRFSKRHLAMTASLLLVPISPFALAWLSSTIASVLSLSFTTICFMPTRHLLRDFLPGVLSLALTSVRVLLVQRDRPAV